MGRKMKKAAVVVAAGMVIGTQIADIPVTGSVLRAETGNYGKRQERAGAEKYRNIDTDVDEAESEKDPDKGLEGDGEDPDKESGDGEDGEKDPDKESGDGEDGEKDPEQEAIKFYHIEYSEPDGKNGYYIHPPEGKITHQSKRGVTRYLFENGNGERQEGTLGKLNESCPWKRMNFTDGRNILEIWMEDEEGGLVENSESRREFWLDSARPEVHVEVAGGSDAWHQEAAEIQVETSDGTNGSQIAEIICKTGEKVIGKSSKAAEKFRIEEESKNGDAVPVTIIAVDMAGNQSAVTEKVFIDRAVPDISIQGIQDYMITSKAVKVNYLTEEENEFQMVQACVFQEDTTGKKEETEITEWETKWSEETGRTRKESNQVLTEDGIYKIRMDVTDMAGHENHEERQVIIDKENPVIAHVEELEGKYLKSFQWDYSIEESIKDFTSYTYTMKLDDTVYRPGEKVEKEGIHTLAVEVTDSAGNKSAARARFTIDRTPPVIRFENIKEGESYEKERKFYVRTENPEDQIEYIKINGKKQKNKKQKAVHEYKVEEAKAYEIEVKAEDLAGNEQISRIGFQVEKEKTLLQKITAPVRKYIFYGDEKVMDDKSPKRMEGATKEENQKVLWEGLALVAVLTGIGFRKRERIKNMFGIHRE